MLPTYRGIVLGAALVLIQPPVGLAQVLNKEAVDQFPALQSSDPTIREGAAKEIALELPIEAAVPALIVLITDGDRGVRLAAVDSLGRLGSASKSALRSLVKCTQDSDDTIRIACVTSLGQIEVNDNEMIESMSMVLKDRSRQVRLAAINALFTTQAETKSKVAGLVVALNDTDPSVRIAAANDLRELSHETGAAVERLGSMLGDDTPVARVAAAKALQKLDADIDNVLPELAKAVTDQNEDVRVAAIAALANSGGGASVIEALTKAQKDPSWHVRRVAVQAMGVVGKDLAFASHFLVDSLSDKTDLVREASADASAKLTHPSAELIFALSKSLNDPDPDLRYYSAKALGAVVSLTILDPSNEPAPQDEATWNEHELRRRRARSSFLKVLANSLRDKDRDVRSASAAALAQIARRDYLSEEDQEQIVTELAGQMLDSDTAVLQGVEKALIALCERNDDKKDDDIWKTEVHELSPRLRENLLNSIGSHLLDLSTFPDNNLRFLTVQLLGRLPLNRKQLQAVIAALGDRDADVRRAAVEALGNLDFKAHEVGTITGLEQPDPYSQNSLRPQGIVALREIPEEAAAISALTQQLKSREKEVRAISIKSLSNNLPQADEITGYLQEGSVSGDAEAESLSITALRSLTSPVAEAYDAVIASLDDPDFVVRIAAVQAFRSVRPNATAIDKLLILAQDKDANTREEAVSTLAKLHEPNVTKALLDVLESDSSEAVRLAAIAAFVDSDDWTDDVGRVLTKSMSDSSDEIREKAIGELSRLQMYDPLLKGAESSDVITRRRCVESLRLNQTSDPERILLALRKATHDPDHVIRVNALFQLGESEFGKPAIPELIEGLTDPVSFNRGIAAKSLGEIGKDNGAVVEALNLLANTDNNPYPVESSINALITIGRIDTVIADLRSKNTLTRELALIAIYNLGLTARAAIPELVLSLKDTNAKNRLLAAKTLAYFGSDAKPAVPVLDELMADQDSEVKRAAIRTLGWIGADARAAIPGLIGALQDHNLRIDAREALLKIASDPADLKSSLSSAADLQTATAEIQNELGSKKNAETLKTTLYDGTVTSIRIDDQTIVIAMGTWCPHSKALREFFVNESNKAYFRKQRLIFLFEDEWLHEERSLIAENQWNPDAEREIIAKKREMGDQPYQDPSFLQGLDGTIYTVQTLKEIGVKYYPSILSPSVLLSQTKALTLTPDDWIAVGDWKETPWFRNHILMPEDTLGKLNSGHGLL